jgi:hypothetical protein
MTVETATYISDLNDTYPTSTDSKSEGDNHLRLIKSVIKATFPNITGPVTKTQAQLNATAGDASGPASSVDNTLPRFDGTTGKLIQGSGVVVDDSNRVGVGRTPSGYALDVGNTASGNYARFGDGTTEFGGYISAGNSFWGTLSNTSFYLGTNGVGRVTLDTSGNLTLSAGTLGYGAGAGGTVTQVTSKATAVTLNKPSGTVTMNSAALAAGASVLFAINNTFFGSNDSVVLIGKAWSLYYRIETANSGSGSIGVRVTNTDTSSRSDPLDISFAVIKGSTT